MGEMNIYVDGVALDNGVAAGAGSSRQIYGQFRISEVIGAGIVIRAAVFLEAASVEAFQDLWAATKLAFQKKDARCVVTLDTSTSTPLEDISPLDGKHQDVVCNVAFADGKEQTETSGWIEFTCAATSNEADEDGQLGDVVCTKAYDATRIIGVDASGVFTSTFDPASVTGLTINSVSNSGGFAVFNVASGAPAYKAGQKIKVSGTTNYDSPSEWHEVTGITANAITTATTYIADDTGTLDVGEPSTGLENYVAQRATIMSSCLLVNSDGSRNSSSELALTGETRTVNDDDESCSFTLNSDWMEVEIASSGDGLAARTFSLEVNTTQPDDWQDVGGARPLMISVKGAVTFDKDQLGRAVKDSDWNTIASKVQQAVKDKTGQSDAKRINLVVSTSAQSNSVAFTATYVSRNLEHFRYEQVVTEGAQLIFSRHRDADGYHTVQKAPGPDEIVQTITVNRSGPGLVSIEPTAPQQTLDGQNGLFIKVSRDLGSQGTFTYDEISGIYTQQGTWTYMKFNLRPGASIQDLKLGVA